MSDEALWHQLVPLYTPGEARAIVRTVMETRYGVGLADLLCDGISMLDDTQQADFHAIMQRLRQAEPVQYVLGEAVFMGRRFHVEPGVLIPRPETEELCRWVVSHTPSTACRILDIGSGSGCIAITLALESPHAQVTAWDISPKALEVTRVNAEALGAHIIIQQNDILHVKGSQHRYDIIVSNPPYICEHEATEMHTNVVNYEPREALFVADDEPLLFYTAISGFATTALAPGGQLFFECHERHVHQVAAMLRDQGFRDVGTLDDNFGKTRFVRAIK